MSALHNLFKERSNRSKKTNLECTICLRTFSSKFNLQRHSQRIHEMGVHHKPNLCHYCGSVLATTDSLKRHIKVHQNENLTRSRNNSLKCPLCDHLNGRKCLLKHLLDVHNVDVSVQKFSFTDFAEFENWKEELEKHTSSSYIKSHIKKFKDKTVHYYRCHRDGFHKNKGNRIRNLKTIGSNKINGHCPARIDVTVKRNFEILASLLRTHLGHEMEVHRLNMTKTERKKIVGQLLKKVPFDDIIRNVKNKNCSKRLQLLTKKDLFNISQSLGIKQGNTPYIFSTLEDWAKENKPVIRFFKQRGEYDTKYSLNVNDFLLIVMNDIQINILRKYGCKLICFDRVYESDVGYYILVYVDEIKTVIPCVLIFTDNMGSNIAKATLEVVKNLCNAVESDIFLSGVLENCFYNTWIKEMGPAKCQLFCPWRVQENWKKNISQYVRHEMERSEMYTNLCELLQETSTISFEIKLEKIVENANIRGYSDFVKYWNVKFNKNRESWAKCYRPISTSNLEEVLTVLALFQLQPKGLSTIDSIINFLMASARDQLFGHSFPFTKDNIRNCKFIKLSEMIDGQPSVFEETEGCWKIRVTNQESYTVKTLNISCFCNLRYPDCPMCVHAFTCSCFDSTVQWKTCQHIHAVHMHIKNKGTVRSDKVPNDCQDFNVDEKCIPDLFAESGSERYKSDLEGRTADEENLKNELIAKFAKEVEGIKTKEECEIVEKLISFVIPTLETVRNNQAKLNSLTLYF